MDMAPVMLVLVTLFLVSSSNGDLLQSKRTHRFRKPLLSSSSSSGPLTAGPDVFYEVSPPVAGSSDPCSIRVMEHAFANTYSLPPAVANYTPPSACGSSWDRIVLKWSGTCKGRQYDRIAAVWFGGVEVLRTCTAEPTSNGIYWEVRKDVSRFASVFKNPQIVVLELANVVDSTYTGIFNINITLEFYTSSSSSSRDRQDLSRDEQFPSPSNEGIDLPADHRDQPSLLQLVSGTSEVKKSHGKQLPIDPLPIFDALPDSSGFPFSTTPPDIIIPISKADGLSGGHWFQLATANDTASVTFTPPMNIYRAVLEVCVSFHGNDEFWYTNPPNDYLEANGLRGYPGNGPFREVQVFLDDMMVGAVLPFPVIFTGGINPLFWRPAAAIGAYNLPSYDVELTPFVGMLVDGNDHTIGMRVENADGSWPLDANLHLWLDPDASRTSGRLLSYYAAGPDSFIQSEFEGLDGTFHTMSNRTMVYSGFIICSLGNLSVTTSYESTFENALVIQNSGSVETITQESHARGNVLVRTPSEVVFSQEITSVFPFYMVYSDESGANGVYTEVCNLTHSFNKETATTSSSVSVLESLKNTQASQGSMTVTGHIVTAGVGALQQHYDYDSTVGCYDRLLSTKNYITLYDITDLSCDHHNMSLY